MEYRLYGRPWGFSFEEVSVPVHLWHDEEDLVVPVHHAEDLASRLPDAKLHTLRDTGHFSIQQHYCTKHTCRVFSAVRNRLPRAEGASGPR